MPYAPLSPCRQPGCPRLSAGPYCPDHQRAATRSYDQARGKTAERGYDARHKRWRAVILARDPICTKCDEAASTVADHVIPLSQGGDFSLENGAGLCRRCHQQKTSAETHGRAYGPGHPLGADAGSAATGPQRRTHRVGLASCGVEGAKTR